MKKQKMWFSFLSIAYLLTFSCEGTSQNQQLVEQLKQDAQAGREELTEETIEMREKMKAEKQYVQELLKKIAEDKNEIKQEE